MCLAVAGPILSEEGEGVVRTGMVRLGIEPRRVSLGMVPEAGVGAWVTVHAGHAIGTLTDAEAAVLADLSDELAGLIRPISRPAAAAPPRCRDR